jgi:transcriptional regulator with AAA-type ATPase domain/pSer/pThr/pTyr-binding forkhead associated (FHA) protein
MLSLEVRKKAGDAEVRRVTGPLVTIGASTGNQVVVRARGVSGRHARIVEKDGGYFLDVFRGVEPVFVNGRETLGGPLGIGDRITIGEAAITLLNGRPSGRVPIEVESSEAEEEEKPQPRLTPPSPTATAGLSEAQYRGLRLDIFRKLKRDADVGSSAREILRFLAQELGSDEWIIGFLEPDGAFHALASTFPGSFEIPPGINEDLKRAMGPLRLESANTPHIFIASPARSGERKVVLAAKETNRFPSRVGGLLEEIAQMADLAWSTGPSPSPSAPVETTPSVSSLPPEVEIVAASDIMRRLVLDLPRIARSKAPVLISGEVGTGKDLVAAALHRQSDAAPGPYIVVDCSSMNRVEEEMFGRAGGGAPRPDRRRGGKIEEALGGTLVLNEIGYLPQAAQSRLLDAMAAMAASPDDPAHSKIRWIATTSTNLLPAVETGSFRRDLYFRLAVLTLRLPSLAERREDIPALFEHFARRYAAEPFGPIEADALNALLTYRYPGNARELENEVVRLAAICGPGEPITLDRLDPKFRETEAGLVLHEVDDLKKIVESVERQVIDRVMRKVEGNQSKGAELLNISRGSLIAKMSEYGIRDYRYLRRERKKDA